VRKQPLAEDLFLVVDLLPSAAPASLDNSENLAAVYLAAGVLD